MPLIAPNSDCHLEGMKYRRQFILGPASMETIPSWKKIRFQDDICLSVHPDLELSKITKHHKTLILLGYILDPAAPEASNLDILNALIDTFERNEEIFDCIAAYGGRWILIVNDGQETILFHDAAGMRHIYYAVKGGIWCSSETGLLASALNLCVDSEAVAFTRFKDCRLWGVSWWPGDTSMYREVKALLPNHYLNLRTGTPHRYWPNKALPRLSFQDAVERSAKILRALIKSAQRRHKLALGCTAGWDSRLMLSACKGIIEDIYCFSLTYQHYTKDTPDLAVPIALFKKLGLELNIIQCAGDKSPEFGKIFRESYLSIDPEGYSDIESMFRIYPANHLCINGDIAEIAKCYYKSDMRTNRAIDADVLVDISSLGRHSFALNAYGKWLSGVQLFGVNILDLFCWEQLVGRWQARKGGAYDLVHESFSPYNCRTLLETMLGVDEKYRQAPDYQFHRALIAELWEEVLCEPINPEGRRSLKRKLKELLILINVYQRIPPKLINIVKGFGK